MTTATAILPTTDTVAELIEHLGGVPPERIRLGPPPGTATEEDLIAAEQETGRLFELIDGVLVEKASGFYESRLAVVLATYLGLFLRKHKLGIALGEGGLMRVLPGQVRIPDIAFYAWSQFRGKKLPREAILSRVPDFAVEILSPANTKREMERKRREYFEGGCQLVWEVFPLEKLVHVYKRPSRYTAYGEPAVLDGGRVLPGFQISIRDWFEEAGQIEASDE